MWASWSLMVSLVAWRAILAVSSQQSYLRSVCVPYSYLEVSCAMLGWCSFLAALHRLHLKPGR